LMKFFDQIPKELEEAALMDGASRLRILWSIIVPLSRPILGAVSIFVFIGAWNNFLWPFIVINDADLMTLPVGLQTVISAYGIQYAETMAHAVLAALPLIVVFLFRQRQIIVGISATGVAGACGAATAAGVVGERRASPGSGRPRPAGAAPRASRAAPSPGVG